LNGDWRLNMCGIVGYIVTGDKAFEGPREHFLKYALSMDTLRGADSTGIMTVKNKFDVTVTRTTQRGDKWVHTAAYNGADKSGWCTVGHNRAATAGSVKISNAHPFTFGDVTMVHNGTLSHKGSSLAMYDKELEVDSMNLALGLSMVPVDGVKEFLETVDGSFTLVWFDKRDKSINFARNSSRSMHFTMNNAKTFMGFMSDGHMLTVLMKSLGADARMNTIYSLDSMIHCKFKKGSLTPEVTKFRPFVRPVVITPSRWIGTTGKQTHGQTATGLARIKWDTRRSQAGGAGKVEINGKVQSIPEAHVSALDMYMELKPTDELCFKSTQEWETGRFHSMVEGQVIMKHWGGAVYPALIMNVPKVQYDSCWSREWTVRPIGLTRPIQAEQDTPTLLCMVTEFNWVGMDGDATELPDTMVTDVDGRFTSQAALQKDLDKGCVNCHSELLMKDISKFMSANNGQDILCQDCAFNQKAGEI
jgi:hypothetical protein